MARQTFYLAKDVRHPLYKTRMLQAGPHELDASAARLYQRLGVELSEEAPKKERPAPKVEAPAPVEKPAEMAAPKPTVRKPVRNRKTGRKVKT